MKKFLLVVVVLSVVLSSVGTQTWAIIPGENAALPDDMMTYGEIQGIIEEYLRMQEYNLIVGTDDFYQYATEQLYNKTDQALLDHPNYVLIDAYFARFVSMYSDYLNCIETLAQDIETGEKLIEVLSDDNPCLLYDYRTRKLSFVLVESFLSQTLRERSNENKERFAEAAFVRTQMVFPNAVTTYSATAAINYAQRYAKNYNSSYPHYPKDCVNFVSQCLYAGGIPMVGSNNTTGTYSSTAQWYCNYTGIASGVRFYALTTSWINNADFSTHMTVRANERYVVHSLDMLHALCKPGDVVQLIKYNGDEPYHSTIITMKNASTAFFCGHTSNRENANIRVYFNEETDYFILYSFAYTPSSNGVIDECGQCGEVPHTYYTELQSSSLERVVECPRHGNHDAELYYYTYHIFCGIHDNYVGYRTEQEYICLNE